MKLTTAYENKHNQGIDDCNTFFFNENIYNCNIVPWCHDTTTLPDRVHESSPNQLVLCLVCPYLLVIYITVYFFKEPRLLMTLQLQPLENIVGKEENAGYQHFLLFLQCFLPIPKRISGFESHLFCRLQILTILTSLKFCPLVKS